MILAPIFRKHREADAEQDATDDSRALVGYHPVFVFRWIPDRPAQILLRLEPSTAIWVQTDAPNYRDRRGS